MKTKTILSTTLVASFLIGRYSVHPKPQVQIQTIPIVDEQLILDAVSMVQYKQHDTWSLASEASILCRSKGCYKVANELYRLAEEQESKSNYGNRTMWRSLRPYYVLSLLKVSDKLEASKQLGYFLFDIEYSLVGTNVEYAKYIIKDGYISPSVEERITNLACEFPAETREFMNRIKPFLPPDNNSPLVGFSRPAACDVR